MAGPSTLTARQFSPSTRYLPLRSSTPCVLVYRLSLRITTQWGPSRASSRALVSAFQDNEPAVSPRRLLRFCTRIPQTWPLLVVLQQNVAVERALPADSGKHLQGPTSINISSSPEPGLQLRFSRISASRFICGATSPCPEEEIW